MIDWILDIQVSYMLKEDRKCTRITAVFLKLMLIIWQPPAFQYLPQMNCTQPYAYIYMFAINTLYTNKFNSIQYKYEQLYGTKR